jgi:hypothetical protein
VLAWLYILVLCLFLMMQKMVLYRHIAIIMIEDKFEILVEYQAAPSFAHKNLILIDQC